MIKPLPPSGFLLISTLIVLSIMILIVGFYLNGIIQAVQVNDITEHSPQAYYLAEAGIQEAIWKLQNDPDWKTNFESNPAWNATFTRSAASLAPAGAYTVTIANQGAAAAIIYATSTVATRGTNAQRVARASVYKALNTNPLNATGLYTNNSIKGTGSSVAVTGGGIFANNDIDLSLFSTWSTTGKAQAQNDVAVSISSSLTAAEGIFDQNNPPLPEPFLMPVIDFDSADPGSYKSRADQIYTSNEFDKLLKDYPVTTLNGITYVTGNVFIKKGHTLTINGALVTDGSIGIGNGFSFESAPAVLTVNNLGTTTPSGLISKKNISIGGWNSEITVNGLTYAGGTFDIKDGITQNVHTSFTGAVVAEDVSIVISWQPTVIQLNQAYVNAALGSPIFSQILFINHWEEAY